jgi:hypothetical protein
MKIVGKIAMIPRRKMRTKMMKKRQRRKKTK